MALNTSPLFNASLWVCGAMKQVMLRLFVPLSPQPLFCSIAPQTPAPIPCSCPGFPPRGNEHIDPRTAPTSIKKFAFCFLVITI